MAQLLQNALYGTALILAAAALRLVLKGRLIPEARLALWAVCLLRLLTPATPESALSLWGLFVRLAPASAPARIPQPYAPAPVTGTPQLYIPAAGGGADIPAPPTESAGGAFPWGTALIGLWLAVGLVLAARYVLSWTRTRRAVACAIPVGRGDPRYTLLPKCARLREGMMEGAPLTFGAARPTVVLPPELSGVALDCVLAHEGVHAARRDNLWYYATALALIVHWWNPAVWLMSRLLRRDIELSCDRAALKKLGPGRRADYANALVSLSTQGGGSAFSHAFGRKLTEERITAIMKCKRMTALGVALSLLLVCGITIAFATEPPQPDPEPAVTEPAENTEPPLAEVETLRAASEQMTADLEAYKASCAELKQRAAYFKQKFGYTPVSMTAQSSCSHPNLMSGMATAGTISQEYSESEHLTLTWVDRRCPDCGVDVTVSEEYSLQPHNFGADQFIGSNHSSPDPSNHTHTYSRTCLGCSKIAQYTVPSGCRKGNCVDPYSLTPEPEVNSPLMPEDFALSDELKATLENTMRESFQNSIQESLNAPVPSAAP